MKVYAKLGSIATGRSPKRSGWGLRGCTSLTCGQTMSPVGGASVGSNISAATTPGLPVGYDASTGQVAGSNTTGATVGSSSNCYPTGYIGPIPSNAVWCATGTAIPPPSSGSPSPSTLNLALGGGGTPTVTTSTYLVIVALLAGLIIIGVK
jgi:hypothetical protein